jgi:hypothetical protein
MHDNDTAQALANVLEAAAKHAAALRHLADNPFGAGHLPTDVSSKAVTAWQAQRRGEADEIDASIGEVRKIV